jgi:hypothetical protein
MSDLICTDGNPEMLRYGQGLGTTGGVQDVTLRDLEQCWRQQADTDNDGEPDQFWPMMLPVIDCPANNVSPCSKLEGAVYVNIVWIEPRGNDYRDAPKEMHDPLNTIDSWVAENDQTLVTDVEQYFVGSGPSDTFPVFPDPQPTVAQVVKSGDTVESGKVRWASFVGHFNLQNADGNYATFAKKSIYFLPDCNPHELVGNSQGENFGVLARIPVLVD